MQLTFPSIILLLALTVPVTFTAAASPLAIQATRVGDAPIITKAMLDGTDGASIDGPSLIRVPSWVPNPLGRYYLYFAHHQGKYIRLAFADHVEGPWTIYKPGVLLLAEQSAVNGHLASPDVIVDESTQQIYLYYHGNHPDKKPAAERAAGEKNLQISSVAVSADGLNFQALNTQVGPAYLRLFPHHDRWYALDPSGMLLSSPQLGKPFTAVSRIIGPEITDAVDPARLGEPGATPVEQRPATGPSRYMIRHLGVDKEGDRLFIYFTFVGHQPERVFATMAVLQGAPETWKAHDIVEVLRPERDWEGAHLPLEYSTGGTSHAHANQLRDPDVFREGESIWLIYAIAGEHGLALARLTYPQPILE